MRKFYLIETKILKKGFNFTQGFILDTLIEKIAEKEGLDYVKAKELLDKQDFHISQL